MNWKSCKKTAVVSVIVISAIASWVYMLNEADYLASHNVWTSDQVELPGYFGLASQDMVFYLICIIALWQKRRILSLIIYFLWLGLDFCFTPLRFVILESSRTWLLYLSIPAILMPLSVHNFFRLHHVTQLCLRILVGALSIILFALFPLSSIEKVVRSGFAQLTLPIPLRSQFIAGLLFSIYLTICVVLSFPRFSARLAFRIGLINQIGLLLIASFFYARVNLLLDSFCSVFITFISIQSALLPFAFLNFRLYELRQIAENETPQTPLSVTA
jgi:hypothetical protein